MTNLLSAYFLILLAVFFLQRHLIYFPERYASEQYQQLLAELSLRPWPSNQDRRALISASPISATKGTIVVFHGNAGSALHRTYYIDALQRHGYRVILAEYPGYGERPGKPSEHEFVQEGIETVKLAYRQFNEPLLFLCGESLGSGVASGIVATGAVPVKGLLLITPFDSLVNVAQSHYWFFLAKWLVRDKYDNVKNLHQFSGNTAVILAGRDEVIANRSTLALYNSLSGHKKLWRFEQSGHNNLPLGAENPWWREVMAFLEAN